MEKPSNAASEETQRPTTGPDVNDRIGQVSETSAEPAITSSTTVSEPVPACRVSDCCRTSDKCY